MNTLIIIAGVVLATVVGTSTMPESIDNEPVPIVEPSADVNEAIKQVREVEQATETLKEDILSIMTLANKEESNVLAETILKAEMLDEKRYASAPLNLREYPTSQSKQVSLIKRADEVTVLFDMKNDWFLVEYNDVRGYVNGKYLQIDKPTPIVNETPKKATKTTSSSNQGGKKMTFKLSFYSNLPEDNGGYTNTASGAPLEYGVVASNVYPFGTKIYVEGYGMMTVKDRGGSHFNDPTRLDVYIPPKSGESKSDYKKRLLQLGRQTKQGTIQ